MPSPERPTASYCPRLAFRSDTLLHSAVSLHAPSGSAKRMAERLPGSVLFRGGDALRNEVHAVNAVGYVGVEAVAAVHLLTGRAPDDIVVGRGVDVGEGLEEGLGVAAGD